MKKRHRKTLRGTVLFTTVAVMALLILFLMGALMLASASNNRAHKSYATSQASYTAKAAIDSFIKAMQEQGAIAASIEEIAEPKGGSPTGIEIDVQMNDPSLGTIGYVNKDGNFVPNKIYAENVGGNEYEYVNEDTGESLVKSGGAVSGAKWVKLDKVKISAAARVGTIGGGEIETVTAYIRKMAGGKTEIENNNAPSVKGIQMTGSAGFPAGKQITGGLGVNLSDSTGLGVTQTRNQMSIDTSLSFINSDLIWKTSDSQIRILTPNPAPGQEADIPYSQTVINGSVQLDNNSWINLDYKMPDGYNNNDPSWSNKEVPYVYVDGAINATQIAVKRVGSTEAVPFNLFCGTFAGKDCNNFTMQSTNLYLMDPYSPSETYKVSTDLSDNGKKPEDRTSTVTVVKGDNYICGTHSTLSGWAYSVVNGTTSASTMGGSIFCNGNLHLKRITIDGDVRVEGDCEIEEETVKINGRLIVGGKLYGAGAAKLEPGKGKFVGQPKLETADAVYKTVENLHVDAGMADLSNYQALKASDYRVNYIKWVPSEHMKSETTTNESGIEETRNISVDIFGNEADANTTIYYRWDDGIVLDSTTLEMAKVIGTESYNTLAENTTFQELVGEKINHQAYYEMGESEDPSHIDVTLKDGDNFFYYAVPAVSGENIVASGTSADVNATFYINQNDKSIITQDEYNALNVEVTPAHYVRCDIDGNPTGEDADQNAYTYYINNDPTKWTYNESEAKVPTGESVAQDSPLPSDIKSIYPKDMTREAIYGVRDPQAPDKSGFREADSSTKIVTTLKEARKSLGLNVDGSLNTDNYPTSFGKGDSIDLSSLNVAIENGTVKDSSVFSKSTSETAPSKGFATISKSCILKGRMVYNANDSLKTDVGNENLTILGDYQKVNNSNSDFRPIYIRPTDNNPLYIVLDNVTFANPSIALIVDRTDGTGEVYFVVRGDLQTNDKCLIIPSDYGKAPFDYTKSWGITYYGEVGSTINIANESTLVGCFKMPQTDFKCNVSGQIPVKYKGENSNDYEDVTPTIVGNALFKSIDATNNFVNSYTATGNGNNGGLNGSKTVLTKVGYFDIMYMSAS
ncbi:MAG: hypothetical protein K6B38_11860 [Ruminococcus sp.]|nr:hypothetical protein [Ruminococcus sp.]